jgi:hypothetical protein
VCPYLSDNNHKHTHCGINPLKPKSRERERVRKESRRVEEKRKYLGESERRFISEGEKEHIVRRYPGNVRSSF